MIAGIVAGQASGKPIVPTEFVVGHAGTLYVANTGGDSLTVDWGDGSPVETTSSLLTHTYSDSTFTGTIYKSQGALTVSGVPLVSVLSIQNGLWGIRFHYPLVAEGEYSVNLVSVPEGLPPSISDLGSAFENATSFNQDISSWDISNVTDMNRMFIGATSFNQDISSWNVSNVTDMDRMFWDATSFNSDISSWNVSNVTGMESMFYNATSFNSDISSWNVSNVTDMSFMFVNATSFNQDLSGWCVSNIASKPTLFDNGATAWTLPKPVWGTCPSG